MRHQQTSGTLREIGHGLSAFLGALVLTLVFFVVLPLVQTVSRPLTGDLLLQAVDTGDVEPPPPPPEQQPEQEAEPEQQPPQLVEQAAPLDLTQLELALNPSFSEDWMASGDFVVKLNVAVARASGNDLDAVFSLADLDETPRAIYQPGPTLTGQLRRKAPGKVNVIFIVDERGRVVEPRARNSTDPIFEEPALNAVQKWKFEPGTRGGKAVRFRMLVPITFPKG